MKRIVEVEIAGKQYPLNFSVSAAKEVAERYGSIENLADAIQEKDSAGAMCEIVWLLALLMKQGANWYRIMEGVDREVLTAEQLESVLGVYDIIDMQECLFAAMTAGAERTVEVEEGKNAETTQSK